MAQEQGGKSEENRTIRPTISPVLPPKIRILFSSAIAITFDRRSHADAFDRRRVLPQEPRPLGSARGHPSGRSSRASISARVKSASRRDETRSDAATAREIASEIENRGTPLAALNSSDLIFLENRARLADNGELPFDALTVM